ncbi:MAG: hypothetical protein AAGF60_06395 [Pseudomonadota bacterium]
MIRSLLTCAALAFAAPAAAQAVLYDCTVNQTSGLDGWVSTRLALVVDAQGAAQVVDSLTLQYYDGAVPARVRNRNGELRFNWSISNATDVRSSRIPTVSYFAWFTPETGAVRVRAKPAGYPQSMRGQGKCTTRENMNVRQLNRLLRG